MAVSDPFIPCVPPPPLPVHQIVEAARVACEHNPANAPPAALLSVLMTTVGATAASLTPAHLAVLVSRYWGARGVRLTVGFLEPLSAALRKRILAHANAWGRFCNVKFTSSQRSPQVRITRDGDGYWSYLGTDVLQIPRGQPTLCLQGFSESTPDSEFYRVVRHEIGHTLGFPHEHARRAIVERLDPARTIAYFQRVYGWPASVTQEQVLTPLDERSIMGTPEADVDSVMTYQFDGECTRDGQPIPGGTDIDVLDRAFAAKLYPLASGHES